jgi:hypothetical protein
MRIPCLLTICFTASTSFAQTSGITYDVRVFYVTCPIEVGAPHKVDINGDGVPENVCNAYRRSLAEVGATLETGIRLNDAGDTLCWDSTDASLPQGVVCITRSDGVANGDTISIVEPDPFQYLAERADGRYNLHTCETGTSITVRYWQSNTSAVRVESTLAHDREPLLGVALDVGPPADASRVTFHINTPTDEWHDCIVFDPKTADGARIMVFVRMRGSHEAIATADASPGMERYSFEFQIMSIPRKTGIKFVEAIETDPAFRVLAGKAQRITALNKKKPVIEEISKVAERVGNAKDVVLLSAPRVTMDSERTARMFKNQITQRTDGERSRPFGPWGATNPILGEFVINPRAGLAIIADILYPIPNDVGAPTREWAGIACAVSANPGPDKTTVSATIAPAMRTMVGLNKFVEQGFRADVQMNLGEPEWFTFEDKVTQGRILVRVIAEAVPPAVSDDFFYWGRP